MLKLKKSICRLLVFVLAIVTIFNIYASTVYAEESSKTLWQQIRKYPQYLLCQIGTLLNGDFSGILSNAESWNNWVDGVSNNPDLAVVNQDGTITFSDEAIQQLQELFDEYLASTPESIDVIWTPVITEKNLKASWFSSTESYYMAMSLLNDHDLIGLYRYHYIQNGSIVMDRTQMVDGTTCTSPFFIDLSDVSIHFNTNFSESVINSFTYLTTTFGHDTTTNPMGAWNSCFVDKTGVNVYPAWYANFGEGWTNKGTFTQTLYRGVYNPFFSSSLYSTGGNFNYFVPVASSKSDISYIPLFANANAYKDWITGNGSYYKFDSGYTGGDITINPDADYSEITDAIADIMKQSIANGDTMARMLANMQSAFSKTLADISGTLGNIGDNTAQTNTWLEKIYELLQNQQEELLEYFENSGKSLDDLIGLLSHTDSSGSRTSIYDLLGSFLLLFRVQQEDLQAFMEDAQDFFKMQPVKVGIMIEAAKQDMVDAIEKVVEAVNGISINIDYGDVDGGSDGESLWSQLGKGLAKILTAVLDLLKVLIFKGLDALGYLAGIMIANIGKVFDGIGVYFDRYIGYIEENTFFAAIRDILPEELQTIMVVSFFSIAVAGIIRYAKRG